MKWYTLGRDGVRDMGAMTFMVICIWVEVTVEEDTVWEVLEAIILLSRDVPLPNWT